ncbi:TRAP transporter large permease subunit [Bradyrhizobium prioriisuperbiae]|uniref:TRAP transporter large permease n=1 Tax=Bradyrhizobium prioriisuperbiae TaxID=2854389 RepID=UPI0028E4085A|nr:TRAP transporter large permease subunit [Bradyrhizobium prioritasuperba]
MSTTAGKVVAPGTLYEGGIRRTADVVDRALSRLLSSVCSAILLVEIVVLLAGVAFRYLLHQPLIWSDELASTLFLWLAMLGSVLAMQRSGHMRMGAIVSRTSGTVREILEAMTLTLALVFSGVMVLPSLEYVVDEAVLTTTALQISGAWRIAALPAGFALFSLATVLRMILTCRRGNLLKAAAIAAAVVTCLSFSAPVLDWLGDWRLAFYFGVLALGLVLGGAHIAVAFTLSSFAYLSISTDVPLTVVASQMGEGMTPIILLSVPLFIFLGLLMRSTGLAGTLVDLLVKLIGHWRGGLSYVLLAAMYLVSGISGSKAADMAAVAPSLVPGMRSRGTRPADIISLLAASGAMSETIPPSLVLIALGSVTGISIAALFTAGLLPALILAGSLCMIVWLKHRRDVRMEPAGGRTLPLVVAALPCLVLPFLIRFAVVEGIATATEVSTLGILYTLVAALLLSYRPRWREIEDLLAETAALSGSILIIFGAATAMSWALTQSGFSEGLAATMHGLPGGAVSFMTASLILFIALGSILEGIPALILFAPLLLPVAKDLGIHEVQYGIFIVLAMGLGLFSPPFGVGYYYACAIAGIDPDEGLGTVWMYMAAMLVGTVLIALVPWLSIAFL